MNQDLFADSQSAGYQPLAAKMRPRRLSEYVGQSHVLGPDKALRKAIEDGHPHSMIFWGPPGVGKTTLARLIAAHCDAHFETLSAVMSGVKDIRKAIDNAEYQRTNFQQEQGGRKTILFVDEVHRFNKSQQDAFLPFVESGAVIFIGATTENPSFELNSALLSRARVYTLRALDEDTLLALLTTALNDAERGLGALSIQVDEDCLSLLARAADGDGRRALNLLEIAVDLASEIDGQVMIDRRVLDEVLQGGTRRYDKGGDIFYEQISAFHKSVRGSSPDGALYWFARMLDGGCDPLYVARRLLAIASEDIGNADPRAMEVALNAWSAFERLGPAEGNRAIAQAAIYCASAPKSNAVYSAFNQAMADVKSDPSFDVPEHLRNAPTALMGELGYGDSYRYAHNEEGAYAAGENYLPEPIQTRRYYYPEARGMEIKIAEKLRYLRELDEQSPLRRYDNLHNASPSTSAPISAPKSPLPRNNK